jgi:hypothetical protein
MRHVDASETIPTTLPLGREQRVHAYSRKRNKQETFLLEDLVEMDATLMKASLWLVFFLAGNIFKNDFRKLKGKQQ